jgi:hypothetical protein
MTDPEPVAVTSGAQRGCGYREPGGAYLAVPLVADGVPVEHFLIDPPAVVDGDALGLSAVGVTLVERDGVTHIMDIVGREHYPTVADFIEEVRRLGVSRRVSSTLEFSRVTSESRLLLLHPHADIANAPTFPTRRPCPCRIPDHTPASYRAMCARLWDEEPLTGAEHRLAVFASFPIPQIEVVRDTIAGKHQQTFTAAAAAGIPVIEVER